MIHRLLDWGWCFGEHAAVKLVNEGQVHAIRSGAVPICAEEKSAAGRLEKGLM
ncbi:hypothetical protein [Bradyrhizobium forestalis]|uniref:hypothetical protein n=1 Tax=Bradyrhizobium forestalis TaxID=1419263 RepID=UPI00130449DE|nr:hypothetical protein [Bradyrhizobium forestalis]